MYPALAFFLPALSSGVEAACKQIKAESDIIGIRIGDPTPSRADIEMTRVVIDVAKPLGITVHERQARSESLKSRNNFGTNHTWKGSTMKHSPRAIALAVLLSLIATSAFPAIAAPSFDCNAAKEEVEKIVCRSEKLSMLDQQIADAYKAALGRLVGDPAAVAAFRDGQRAFVALRDKGLNANPDDVAEFMETHRNFLRSITPRARDAFLGIWETVGGVVIVRRGKRGTFDVNAETFGDPLWGNRYCGGGGNNFSMKGRTLASSNGPGAWNQKLSRSGHLLVLQEIAPKARKGGEEMRGPDYLRG